jgi:hypothetical protein
MSDLGFEPRYRKNQPNRLLAKERLDSSENKKQTHAQDVGHLMPRAISTNNEGAIN